MIGSNQSELEGQYSSYVLAFPLFYSNALFKIYTLSVVTICCKIEMGHLRKKTVFIGTNLIATNLSSTDSKSTTPWHP